MDSGLVKTLWNEEKENPLQWCTWHIAGAKFLTRSDHRPCILLGYDCHSIFLHRRLFRSFLGLCQCPKTLLSMKVTTRAGFVDCQRGSEGKARRGPLAVSQTSQAGEQY